MIHIFKAKNGQFCVVTKARNGEVLNVSESFPQKVKAWKNIASAAMLFNAAIFNVQDDTVKGEPAVYQCIVNNKEFTKFKVTIKPLPRHHS